MLGTIIDDAIDSGLSALGGALGVTSEAQNPYMQKAKQSTTDFMNKPWLQGWQWAIEATGAPTDLDMYVKDVDFGFLINDRFAVQSFPDVRYVQSWLRTVCHIEAVEFDLSFLSPELNPVHLVNSNPHAFVVRMIFRIFQRSSEYGSVCSTKRPDVRLGLL